MNQRVMSKERTRAALVAAARKLFGKHGYARTGIRDIAKLAGYSTGAVFAMWSGKDDLWREVMGMATPDEFFDGVMKAGSVEAALDPTLLKAGRDLDLSTFLPLLHRDPA